MTTTELTQRDNPTTAVDRAIVKEISLKHRVAQDAANEAVRVAAEAGELLAKVKAQLKHGDWEPWLEANFEGGATTARGYRRLAANRQRVADLPSVREALKALAPPGRHPEGKHLLVKGMLRCALCGGPMLARKAQGPGRAGERYFCKVRYEADENACSMPGIRRELIDEPFLASVLERHIDLDATVKRIAERADAALVRAQEAVAGCEADVARVERALITTERDYDAGELTARQYSKREDRLAGELEGAKAALEQARVNAQQMERAGPVDDAEQELLDRLATLNAAVASGMAEAPDLPALRNVIARMFDSIDLVRCRKTERVYVIEAPAKAAGVVLPHLDKWIGEGQAVAGDGDTCYLLLPGLRYEALDPETEELRSQLLPVAPLMEPPTSPVA
jgi:hypothetical protein